MKKGIVGIILGIVVAGLLAWQKRVELLVWAGPTLLELSRDIQDNRPVEWAQGPATALVSPAERPPNIILILTDDMGFNDISLYNGGAADGTLQTPNIDALAQQGVTFTNGYAGNAVCAPSRASLMTGRYATRFGFEFTPVPDMGVKVLDWIGQSQPDEGLPSFFDRDAIDNKMPFTEQGMPASEVTVAEALKSAGYYTAHIGKWHLGNTAGMRPEEQGFDDSLLMTGTLYLPENHPDVVNAKRLDDPIEKMVWAFSLYSASFNNSELFRPDGYLTDYYTGEAIKVIEANQHQPFFLYLAHWGVHNPLQATREDYEALAHIEDHHLRVYAAMIRSLDRSVGAVTAKLEELGLAENTLVILTSDNGGADYIQLPDINKPFRGWKLTQFEGGTHVPFMAKWPAEIAPGSVYEAPVHHNDVYLTAAAAANAGVPTDRVLDGVDLLPFVRGEVDGIPHETLFWREGHHQSVRHQDWKLIRAGRPDKRWLFNLAEDPTEQNNLAAVNPDKVGELEALLNNHNAYQLESMWPALLDSPKLIDKHSGETYVEGDDYIYWPN